MAWGQTGTKPWPEPTMIKTTNVLNHKEDCVSFLHVMSQVIYLMASNFRFEVHRYLLHHQGYRDIASEFKWLLTAIKWNSKGCAATKLSFRWANLGFQIVHVVRKSWDYH